MAFTEVKVARKGTPALAWTGFPTLSFVLITLGFAGALQLSTQLPKKWAVLYAAYIALLPSATPTVCGPLLIGCRPHWALVLTSFWFFSFLFMST